MQALNAQLVGKRSRAELPLDIQGTAFQKRVWEFLRTVPSGDVLSYAEVAQAVGAPKAVRAAASACASNRIGVLIPCHRVIRGDGGLGGYRWGLPRKRALLDMERRTRGAKSANQF
jgi:AraC family transcriptional regulator of adaptative response/methylated-DNA-[protein]-cysteine methyltransferase